ncbi:MAG: tetratricopeptide repeat protein [Gammaproteobacteria bacterium]|nr:tetratricopeptide repeat protein [Gammaproteobacteria bacterium]
MSRRVIGFLFWSALASGCLASGQESSPEANRDQPAFFLAQVDASSSSSEEEDTRSQADDSYFVLFEKIQKRLRSLESTVSGLQGRIEDLEFQIQEAQHSQQRRISNIEQRVQQSLGSPSVASPVVSDSTPVDIVNQTTPGSDESFYAQGMNSLKNADYESSVAYFDQLLKQYPNSEYSADSLYWIGEIYASFEPQNLERARQRFVQLIRLYPDHEQIPKAIYKLGTVYHQLGDDARALEYLNQVILEYASHEVAQLATEYASQIK